MYNPVIDGFCKAGNVDEGNVILKEMEEKRCKPDKAGMPNEAYRIRKMALEDRNLGLSSFEKAIPLRTNTYIPVAV
ncbi:PENTATRICOPEPTIDE REPEAT-CONTAINING PROTEIN 3 MITOCHONDRIAL [Salix viminalis]|uniref:PENTATRICOPEPTIDE REPEAT-CONTAINING PROTEIN 3 MITOCHONDRIAL n=1 Tax=Salix viminalis TaxID=40686 RepID=A0A9Q0V7R1_SALVM|nr:PENTATRICOPEPTIDE REPEAT-CONTAINING PROTEIN 3 MITOCHONDRIAL [Salix viminalis]